MLGCGALLAPMDRSDVTASLQDSLATFADRRFVRALTVHVPPCNSSDECVIRVFLLPPTFAQPPGVFHSEMPLLSSPEAVIFLRLIVLLPDNELVPVPL